MAQDWKVLRHLRICDNNGVILGWKKILVLYTGGKGKGHKTNWTMHQCHLGVEENEKHGEYVVSRVFYQVESNKTRKSPMYAVEIDPTTPNAYTPQPRCISGSPLETEQNQDEEEPGSSGVQPEDCLTGVAGTSQQAGVDYAVAGLSPLHNDDIHETPVSLDHTSMDSPQGFCSLESTFLRMSPDLFTPTDSLSDWLARNSAKHREE